MQRRLVPLLLLPLLLVAPAQRPAMAADTPSSLSVRLDGFRSAEGQVLVAIFRGESGFPGDPARAWKTAVLKIHGQSAALDLAAVPAGTYGISVIHDEDGDNELDTNFLGIPKEGIGTSNNAKGRFGPPKWADAKFEVRGSTTQKIRIVYL